MTEEENKKYEEKRAILEALTEDQKMEKLDELLEDVFMMANSFAGNRGPSGVATSLHESANKIMHAQKILKGEIEPGIPIDAVARACGLDIPGMAELLMDISRPINDDIPAEPGRGTSMLDLQVKEMMEEDE